MKSQASYAASLLLDQLIFVERLECFQALVLRSEITLREEFVYPEACLFSLLIQVNLVKDTLSSFHPFFSYILSRYSYNNRTSESSHLEHYQILVLASNQ